jgi:hypothetical protein
LLSKQQSLTSHKLNQDMTNATQQTKRHIFYGLLATLFVASTVCCILDDKNIDRSKTKLHRLSRLLRNELPVCGSQYQAQFETERLQKGIALDSDSMCQSLEVAYQNTWLNIDFPHQRSEWLVILDCQSSPSLSPASTPLRI